MLGGPAGHPITSHCQVTSVILLRCALRVAPGAVTRVTHMTGLCAVARVLIRC